VLDFLKDKGGLKAGSKALDIGSGIGRVTFLLKQDGYDAYALEPKKELFDFGIEHGFTERTKSFNIPYEIAQFGKDSFDFIFLEPLNHLAEPHLAIQKTLEWLKPGGYLHLQVANHKWLYKRLLKMLYKITFRKHVPYTSTQRKPFNACEYSAKSFKVYAELNNLELCQINAYACNTFMPFRLLDKWMGYYMWRFNRGMELSLILRKPVSKDEQ